ncbi:hydantoinase/oxoprolinase family protein [bacterium]|nr:hydantoinase/oxoprolinase family protein [bacterium]
MTKTIKAGIDTGGTFTDIILSRGAELLIKKIPSRQDAPERAIADGLSQLVQDGERGAIVHGTTIATNALLSRTGARTALVTTEGFEDLLEIGRQNRPKLYDFFARKPKPLAPREMVFGASERTLYTGDIEKALSEESLQKLKSELAASGAESIAVCLLFSYANAQNERIIRETLAGIDAFISISSEVLPAYREYERLSTTVVNAYVAPSVVRYLERLQSALNGWKVLIMQSNGGSLSVSATCKRPVVTILSGPAGGAIAAKRIAEEREDPKIISFDMGGTSTDVSLISGGLTWGTETSISGCPIAIPVIDIKTVGAGGGSIAYLDEGGALRVGPKSAGADPGPACYGKGDLPTVTDANLVLGRISPEWFLGGEFEIDAKRGERAIGKLAAEMSIPIAAAAEGIVRVANATMQRALSVVSVQQGFDPREFSIVAFGGAGPVHACDLCRAIGAVSVIVPRNPGLLSAIGMLRSDMLRDYKKSILIPASFESLAALWSEFAKLEAEASIDLQAESNTVRFKRRLEMRYIGQSHEIDLEFSEKFLETFDTVYMQKYGYLNPDKQKEIVSIRLMAIVPSDVSALEETPNCEPDGHDPRIGSQRVIENGQAIDAALYRRDWLSLGDSFCGPAVIVEYSATTYLPSDFSCEVDRLGNLVLIPK